MRLRIALAALMLFVSLPSSRADQPPGGGISPGEAGEIASRQTGGRVLAVKPAAGGYQVKILTPDGQVRYVFVAGR
ncbi:PepSY domain-containing protein [Thiobaca trueperi]|uniref:YpeB-like protein with protease inhibitory function n=1 Tax=Thiobaca trueperi TaxID=127458 RepID=A0A4R3MSZ6_9GAMM|nr:PepSY domain-containing protein [Thiobaca trueperi]TCT19404.1 hypothetical protein EDC35_10810 [Thiobaca trueperi]